jgi:hypothetical protein
LRRNKGDPTVSETLDLAQANAEKARKGPHDLVGRDVEYYLKSRWEVSKRESSAAKWAVAGGGVAANLIYSGLKAAAIGLGAEPVMRTDPDVPVTPPGGISWGSRGCADGTHDFGKAHRMPALLNLVDLTLIDG